MKVTWKDEYSVGVKEIDDQHKQFIELINQIYEVIAGEKYGKECCVVLDYLGNYALYHLETEEEYFKKFNYEKAEEHIAEHNKYRKKIGEWASKCPSADDRLPILKEAADFTTEWLIAHILGSDKQYIECFKKHGLQ